MKNSFLIQSLATIAILGILAAVATSLWVTYRLDTPLGPIAVTHSPNQTLYVATGKLIFKLNGNGSFLSKYLFQSWALLRQSPTFQHQMTMNCWLLILGGVQFFVAI